MLKFLENAFFTLAAVFALSAAVYATLPSTHQAYAENLPPALAAELSSDELRERFVSRMVTMTNELNSKQLRAQLESTPGLPLTSEQLDSFVARMQEDTPALMTPFFEQLFDSFPAERQQEFFDLVNLPLYQDYTEFTAPSMAAAMPIVMLHAQRLLDEIIEE